MVVLAIYPGSLGREGRGRQNSELQVSQYYIDSVLQIKQYKNNKLGVSAKQVS